MARQPKSQQNQSIYRYALVLIVGILFGRQWTLFTADPHGVLHQPYHEEHPNMHMPKLQDPSSESRIRDLEQNIPTNPVQSSPVAAPIQDLKQEIPSHKPTLAPKGEGKGASTTTENLNVVAPEEADNQDENDEDGESKNDNDEDHQDDEDGESTDKSDGHEENKDDETTRTVQPDVSISLATLAPKLMRTAPVITSSSTVAPADENEPNDVSGDNIDIAAFQAEIDRRLPLWQAEAAKEDGLQDPPTVTVYDGVVLATKVHYVGRQSVNQMICLQKAAYNHRRNYPWVIFHTAPVTPQQVAEARAVAYPGTVTFVQDSPPLEEVVGNFSKEEQDYLIDRCQCCHPKDSTSCCKDKKKKIDWGFWCHEEKTGWVTLSYAWQAVFRSYDIWTQPALKDYKYMVWIDDDAIPTKSWLKDPLKPMVEEDLVIFYDNFPAGFCKSGGIIEKMELAYNHSYCYIHRIEKFKGPQTGKFVLRPCKKNKKGKYILDKVGLVHGMMHITNLDVYRKPIHLNFQRILTQHNTHPFSREWDDQIAVTVPAAFENPDKAWDMRMHGFNMSIHHNGKLDGKQKNKKWKYTTWWKYYKDEFPVGREMCDHLVKFGG